MEKRGFKGMWIPKEIWLDSQLSWMEKLMLVEIDSLDNEDGCWANNQYFANFFGLSKSRVAHIIMDLRKKGYVTVNLFKTETGAVDKRVIRIIKKWECPVSKNTEDPIAKNSNTYCQKQHGGHAKNSMGGIAKNSKDNNTIINNTKNNIYNTSNASISNQNDMFETIWNEYPNKQGKAKALAAYKKAIANGTDPKKILEGVQRYKRHIQANKTEAKYIAHGSTWFNQERWNDELPEPKGQGPIKPVEYQPSAEDLAALEELKASGGEPF